MSDHFRKISRYECIWCGSIFKTDNKHRCKFNPDYRNCYSCRYCDGIESMESTYSVPFAAHENASAVLKNIVDTETLKKIACRKGHAVYTRDIALKKNEYMCPDHEIMENYEKEQELLRQEEEARIAMNDAADEDPAQGNEEAIFEPEEAVEAAEEVVELE